MFIDVRIKGLWNDVSSSRIDSNPFLISNRAAKLGFGFEIIKGCR